MTAGVVLAVTVPGFLSTASFTLISAGLICLVIAKASLFSQGIWTSWGTGRMTRWNARIYCAGYLLIGFGAAAMFFSGP
jgi:hypothetical protein